MLRLIHFLVYGRFPCEHKWKIIEDGKLQHNGAVVGCYHILQCEKCGNVKRKNMTASWN